MREKEGFLIHHSDETGATLSEYIQILNQFFLITVKVFTWPQALSGQFFVWFWGFFF